MLTDIIRGPKNNDNPTKSITKYGYLYVIELEIHNQIPVFDKTKRIVKIGYSQTVASRISSIKSTSIFNINILKVVPLIDAKSIETKWHRYFKKYKTISNFSKEWFALTDEQINYLINELDNQYKIDCDELDIHINTISTYNKPYKAEQILDIIKKEKIYNY